MQEEILTMLIKKYLDGNASIDEIHQVDAWYDSFKSQKGLYVRDTVELKKAVAKGFLDFKFKLGID